jgi:phosphoribosylanthranilate isomerase
LLDGFKGGLYGGTGRTADWTLARRAQKYGRVILAGGIRPGNVAQAVAQARPYAVDVASGVESRPGKKDASALRELMREVEAANRKAADAEGKRAK